MPRKPAPNRTDLKGQAAQVPTGLSYGEAQKLRQAQTAVPAAGQPVPAAPGAQAAPGPAPVDWQNVQAQAQAYQPGHTPLTEPTERPNEPLTAGLPSGPGPGPEILPGGANNLNAPLEMLRALYVSNPFPELGKILEQANKQ